MKKSGWVALVLTLAVGGAFGCSQEETAPQSVNSAGRTERTEIILSAAASLSGPLQQIKSDLEQTNSDLLLTLNLGASGTLKKQIEQGAPADLFWSAAAKQMNELGEKGLLADGTRSNVAGNELVLIVPKQRATDLGNIHTFSDLTQESVKKIAIGSPETVPAGTYGQEVLQKMNVWNALSEKLVFGKDVKQVLTYVERGDVDAGIVYASDAKGSEQIQVLAEADPAAHQPIVYPIAILKSSQHQDLAKRVLEYIKSDKAQSILTSAGFTQGVN